MLYKNETVPLYAKQWLRVSDVAKLLSVSESTVRNWISAKLLSVHRYGRLIVIRQSNLEKFLEEGRIGKR